MEEPNQIAQMKQITAFYEHNPTVLKNLKTLKVNRNYDILHKVSLNKPLFMKYFNLKCEKFRKVSSALECNIKDKIVVYFADINLYAVFAGITDYIGLQIALRDIITRTTECKNKCEDQYDECTEECIKNRPATPKFLISQIVLSDLKQRMVFVSSTDSVDLIRKYVKEFLKSETSVIRSPEGMEITVLGLVFNDLSEARNGFEKFCSQIEKECPAALRGTVPLRQTVKRSCAYTSPSLDDMLGDDVDLQETLKSGWFGNAPKTINIFNNCNVGAVGKNSSCANNELRGNNHSRVKPKPTKRNMTDADKAKIDEIREKLARKWVGANPPGENEMSSLYHRRYQDSNTSEQTPVPIQTFAQIMYSLGYRQTVGSQRYWYL